MPRRRLQQPEWIGKAQTAGARERTRLIEWPCEEGSCATLRCGTSFEYRQILENAVVGCPRLQLRRRRFGAEYKSESQCQGAQNFSGTKGSGSTR